MSRDSCQLCREIRHCPRYLCDVAGHRNRPEPPLGVGSIFVLGLCRGIGGATVRWADNRYMVKKEPHRLTLFKRKMKPTTIIKERATSIRNAFASALASVGNFDEEEINKALMILGQGDSSELLTCVYCGAPAKTADHLNGLVIEKRYSGHGQVIGNLVPCCTSCNSRKGNKAWRKWCEGLENFSEEQKDRLTEYESLAPQAVGHDELMERYPDLMTRYEQLQEICIRTMQDADGIAKEIQDLEAQRRSGQG